MTATVRSGVATVPHSNSRSNTQRERSTAAVRYRVTTPWRRRSATTVASTIWALASATASAVTAGDGCSRCTAAAGPVCTVQAKTTPAAATGSAVRVSFEAAITTAGVVSRTSGRP